MILNQHDDYKNFFSTYNILGSCVTRDAFELCESMKVNKYVARQSLIYAVSEPVTDTLFNQITFNETTTSFGKRIILEDAKKNYFTELDLEIPLIIDLIDERLRIFKIDEKSLLTYSDYADKYTDIRKLVKQFIFPYTKERLVMFYNAMNTLKNKLDKRKILIHYCLYDEVIRDKSSENYGQINEEYVHANRELAKMYSILAKQFCDAQIIKVPDKLRMSSVEHKWGVSPFHFHDEYYKTFLKILADKCGAKVVYRENATLQNQL